MMTTEKLVTQSYVITEDGNEHKLEYYIFSKPLDHRLTYGITIKNYKSYTIESETEFVSENEADVLFLIDCFSRNFVFPSSLCDLIDDMNQLSAPLRHNYHNYVSNYA